MIDAITENRRVVGDASHLRLGNPADAEAPLLIRDGLRPPAKAHLVGDLRARDFPRVAVAQPFVRDLLLPPISDDLIEDAKLITNAVADGRHLHAGHGIHVTGGEPAESAVAQAGLFFLGEDLVKIVA